MMKNKLSLWGLGMICMLVSCQRDSLSDYTQYVNPFVGTAGHGHTYPGATYPHGMIQPSPDTRIYEWDACSGYYYADSTINGFSHTHLSGTGCGDYGDVLLMPTVGKQQYHYMGVKSQTMAYASPFSHEKEEAEPGYYSVFLDRYGVQAELTATPRAAIHRYTFPESEQAGFILDLDYSLQRQTNEMMELEIVSDTEIRGRKKTVYWAFDQYISFCAKFSRPMSFKLITDSITIEDGRKVPQAKVLAQFKSEQQEQVYVKVAVSAVDMDGASQNLSTEIPKWDFDGVRKAAHNAWNDYLSKIEVATDNDEQKRVFYTALYHTAMSPNIFTDIDGRYRGMDLKIHQHSSKRPIYTVFSLWDTFRALHPLMTIIDPDLNNDFINSLLIKHREGGVLPMWELAGNYTGTMIGYHAVSLFADAYAKGSRGFDINQAYQASLRVARYDTAGINCPALVLPHLMPMAKSYKNTIGYIPCNLENESVAKALEYAYDDWCIAQMADWQGDSDTHNEYMRFSKAYELYYDTATCFMRGIDADGEWRVPFNPRSSTHRSDDYCEGTAWQWTWFVPHDIEGLVSLMGGREPFINRLDSLFLAESAMVGEAISVDISGLIGQYAHGNEPGHHITHLYNYVGQPWKTQALTDSIMQTLYFNDPNGLSGNEDCGQMSAWYVLNAMGFYQVCPGKPVYSIGRPLFDQVKIALKDSRYFTITAENNSAQNKYIQSATLNGNPLLSPFITHQDIMSAGTLVFKMGATPSKWGTVSTQNR